VDNKVNTCGCTLIRKTTTNRTGRWATMAANWSRTKTHRVTMPSLAAVGGIVLNMFNTGGKMERNQLRATMLSDEPNVIKVGS